MTAPDDTDLETRFASFDTNKNGAIDEDEFARLVGSLGVRMSPEALQTAFMAIDVNGNGRIDLGEFRGWWSRTKK